MEKPKIILIVGPTASGKTSLSIKIAKEFGGEVISADSRQVYRGLDIGSGKVTQEEMAGIPHHLLDVAEPMSVYTADDFKRDGQRAIEDILSRHKLPIMAGGTFFYSDILLGRISTPEVPPDEKLRTCLEKKNVEELFCVLEQLDSNRADKIDKNNKRRLIRAIEVATSLGSVPEEIITELYDVLTIGIKIDKEILHQNIHSRLLERLETGMIDEVRGLINNGVTHERLEALGLEYRYLSRFLCESIEYEEMIIELETKIRQFAKRQMTWLKRDLTILWVNPEETDEIFKNVSTFLS